MNHEPSLCCFMCNGFRWFDMQELGAETISKKYQRAMLHCTNCTGWGKSFQIGEDERIRFVKLSIFCESDTDGDDDDDNNDDSEDGDDDDDSDDEGDVKLRKE